MKKFRLLKETRQSTEYTSGASALQAVLSYWGKDMDEEETHAASPYHNGDRHVRMIPSDSFAKLVQGLAGGR